MTRLEAALLFVAVWEASALAVLAWRIRRLEADLAKRRAREFGWTAHFIPVQLGAQFGSRGSGKTTAGADLRRQVARALGVRFHGDDTVSEVLDVPVPLVVNGVSEVFDVPSPPVAKGDEVVLRRLGDEPRRYRVLDVGFGRLLVEPESERSRDL